MDSRFILSIYLCLFVITPIHGQELQQLSLKEAYEMLESRYPNLQNEQLLPQIFEREQQQLRLDRLPSIYLMADGRLQSESTRLDADGADLPFEIEQPLVNVGSYLEAQFDIYDGGLSQARKTLLNAQLAVDQQNVEVERYSLRARINHLFLSIRLLREQDKVFDYSLADLEARKAIIAAGVEQGTTLESELSKITVRELELNAQKENANYQQNGLIESLSSLIGAQLSKELDLEFPQMPTPLAVPALIRPELELFKTQRETIMAQSALIEAQRRPRLSAYAQGGFGYPNRLNILDNGLAPFATIGFQFSWKITDWKKSKSEKEVLALQAQQINHAEESFAFNLNTQEANYLAEIKRLESQITYDSQIARQQAEILKQLAAQLDEGVITSADYITQVNAELSSRQNLLIHQTQLIQTQLEFWNDRGVFPSK